MKIWGQHPGNEKCRMKKMICEIERRRSLCRLSGCLRPSRKQRKRRSLGNNCCDPARQWERIIERRIADAARRNLFRSAAIRSANLRLLTGLTASRGKDCPSRNTFSSSKRMRRIDRHFRHNSPAIQRDLLILPSSFYLFCALGALRV